MNVINRKKRELNTEIKIWQHKCASCKTWWPQTMQISGLLSGRQEGKERVVHYLSSTDTKSRNHWLASVSRDHHKPAQQEKV